MVHSVTQGRWYVGGTLTNIMMLLKHVCRHQLLNIQSAMVMMCAESHERAPIQEPRSNTSWVEAGLRRPVHLGE